MLGLATAYLLSVLTNDKTFQTFQRYVSSVKLPSYIHYCPCSNTHHDIHDNESDHTRFRVMDSVTIVGIISLLVIWYLKLQAYTNLLLTSTAFPILSHAITSLTTTVTERIYKDLNLSLCQIIFSKTNVNENITNALRPTHRGLGCNTYHSNLHSNFYSLTIH